MRTTSRAQSRTAECEAPPALSNAVTIENGQSSTSYAGPRRRGRGRPSVRRPRSPTPAGRELRRARQPRARSLRTSRCGLGVASWERTSPCTPRPRALPGTGHSPPAPAVPCGGRLPRALEQTLRRGGPEMIREHVSRADVLRPTHWPDSCSDQLNRTQAGRAMSVRARLGRCVRSWRSPHRLIPGRARSNREAAPQRADVR